MEILGLDALKSAVIILAVLLYWKFVYYKYHKKDFTPISFFVVGGCLVVYGFYAWYFEKIVSFENIKIIASIFLVFAAFSLSLVFFAIRRHGFIKEVDINLTWIKKHFGIVFAYLCIFLAFPVYVFIMLGTYRILGKECIIFWALIILAWAFSNIRLIKKGMLK